jgi:uncharacterized protein (TIRG00374 family)
MLNTRLLSRLALLLGGTVLGVALLVLLLRSVNLSQLGNDFSNADYWYLIVAIVPFLINLLLKVPRWALLYGEGAPGWDTLFGAMNVGYAINALFPARLGEIVRAYYVRDRSGIGMVRTLSTIALERVTDGLTLIVLLVITATTVAFPKELVGPVMTIGAVFVAVMLGMAVLAYSSTRENHPLTSLIGRLESGRWPFVGNVLRQITTGLQALRSRQAVVLLLVYTLIIWGSNSLLLWLTLRAFHIAVPFTGAILLIAVLNLGMAVPSTPGYVGVFDYLMVLTLALYSVPRTQAVAAALVFHAIAFVPITIIGLVYIVRTGLETTLQMVRRETLNPLPQSQTQRRRPTERVGEGETSEARQT